MTVDLPRPLLVAAALLLVVRIGLEVHEAHRPGSAATLRWYSVPEALAEADRSGKPLLYDFSADWCRPCKRMDREVFADADTGAWLTERFVAVRVEDGLASDGLSDAEAEDLRRSYDVEAFPTLLVVHEGEIRGRQVGYRDRDSTLDLLRATLPTPP